MPCDYAAKAWKTSLLTPPSANGLAVRYENDGLARRGYERCGLRDLCHGTAEGAVCGVARTASTALPNCSSTTGGRWL